MSTPAVLAPGKPTLRIGGTAYPVLLPTLRDPRLHLAAVIVTLQVLGQVAFEFDLSIAQILVALSTCAVLEVSIAFRKQRVLMWPASALLTGNGVAFVLRVPGTEHGDWWSLHGWWLFAGTAAVGLLSKYVITYGGRHIFNPSNFGLVLCFAAFGPERADPLAFWWGPMSGWLALALALIVGGGLLIIGRLHLLSIAVGFWLTFAAGVAVLAATGHQMTAAWHLGPIEGWDLWWLLVTSPEVLVFLFFMITDPRTIPASGTGRRVYAVAVGFLAVLLIAPWTSEFAAKLAVLASLFIVCAARPLLLLLARNERVAERLGRLAGRWDGRSRYAVAGVTAVAALGLLVAAGVPSRPASAVAAPADTDGAPTVTVVDTPGLAPIDEPTARVIAADFVTDLRHAATALRTRNREHATRAATGRWLAVLWETIDGSRGGTIDVPTYEANRLALHLEAGEGQEAPVVVATLSGTIQTTTYGASPGNVVRRGEPTAITRTFELAPADGRYLIASVGVHAQAATVPAVAASFRLTDVAADVGLDFRQQAFRFGISVDPTAMMGGGLCWLDYDGDGWLDLYAVNTYAESDIPGWEKRSGLPRSRLYRNVQGRFQDVTSSTGTGLRVRGSGCVAGDFDGNGTTDLFVTTAGYDAQRDAYDALLWNDGDGTFTEGAWDAGIRAFGWHTGAAAGDVNGDGRLDLFVAGYTDVNNAIPGSSDGFPANHEAMRDLLYLNVGGSGSHPRFREVGHEAGLEPRRLDHGLGATFTDVDEDGRLDLYVANDLDPNRLYRNVRRNGGLGFAFVEVGGELGVNDPNAGMGVAFGDYSGDAHDDVFVTNSRGQLHAAYRSREGQPFADARPYFAPATGQQLTGWGVTWADLDLDGTLELAIANGAIPVTNLAANAERLQILSTSGSTARPLDAGDVEPRNARGLAAADYDNDGDLDLAVGSIGGRLQLLRNDGAEGHWLEVALERLVPGTRVTVVLENGQRLTREARIGGSYLSSEDPRLHFGLGDQTRAREVVVQRPDGRVTRLQDVAADRLVSVD